MPVPQEVSNWKANYPGPYRSRLVSRAEVGADSVIRGRLLRPIAAVLTYAILPIAVLFGLIDWAFGHRVSPEVTLAALVGVSSLVALLAFLLVFTIGNYGIALKPEGVDVYGYTLPRRQLIVRSSPWGDLQQVESWGLYSEIIWLGHSNIALTVTPEEARAILLDPRCLLYGKVPNNLAHRLGMNRRS
jgi:hypothetical protein